MQIEGASRERAAIELRMRDVKRIRSRDEPLSPLDTSEDNTLGAEKANTRRSSSGWQIWMFGPSPLREH